MRIFSSAENCRRVARRISFTTASAGFFLGPDFCLIFALMAMMIQKSSVSANPKTVSRALMADNAEQAQCGSPASFRWCELCGSDSIT
jgi:hypothetical protein